MSAAVLLCDFSKGDHVRLAMAEMGRRPECYSRLDVDNATDFDEALLNFSRQHADRQVKAVAISAPGWESRGIMSLPNHAFNIDREHLKAVLDIQRVHLVNAAMAKALSISILHEGEFEKICGGAGEDSQMKGIIGCDLGMGTAALFYDEQAGWIALPCLGGHSDLPSTTDREDAVRQLIGRKYGHAARGRAVSVLGLVDIWQSLNVLEGIETSQIDAAEIVSRARGNDAIASEAVALCVGWLAATVSDMALFLGARGGVYLAGSLFDLLGDFIVNSDFTERLLAKGRLKDYLADIPIFRITARDPEILGLTTLFEV